LARILDVEAKIPRTFDALGPVGGRDVLMLDGAPGIRARQLTELGARVVFAAMDDARIDAPDGSADVVASRTPTGATKMAAKNASHPRRTTR